MAVRLGEASTWIPRGLGAPPLLPGKGMWYLLGSEEWPHPPDTSPDSPTSRVAEVIAPVTGAHGEGVGRLTEVAPSQGLGPCPSVLDLSISKGFSFRMYLCTHMPACAWSVEGTCRCAGHVFTDCVLLFFSGPSGKRGSGGRWTSEQYQNLQGNRSPGAAEGREEGQREMTPGEALAQLTHQVYSLCSKADAQPGLGEAECPRCAALGRLLSAGGSHCPTNTGQRKPLLFRPSY